MLRLTNRRSSLFISVFAFLLAWILGPTSYYGSFCNASMWSYMTGSSETTAEDDQAPIADAKMDTVDDDELVSPIVNREINVSVEAPWPSSSEHSVLCEAFLFLKGDHSFLDALVASHGRNHLVTFERSTKYALELAAGLGFGDDLSALKPNIRLLKVALAMRAMAPACELHRSIAHSQYPDHVVYLETFGVITYDTKADESTTQDFVLQTSAGIPKSVEEMPKMTKAQRNAFLLPEEVIREGSETIIVNKDDDDDDDDDNDDESEMVTSVVVLYTQLGGTSFATFYRKLVENKIPFVVRHMGSVDDDETESVLQGYGVRVDVRNVEYKVFDDKKRSDTVATEDAMINLTSLGAQNDFDTDGVTNIDDSVDGVCDTSTNSCPEDVQSGNQLTTHFLAGINLTALDLSTDGDGNESQDGSAEEMQRQLWKLHNRFRQHSQLIPPTWQRRHLSIQAATAVAGSRDPLIALQDISQNLPSMASTLVHVTVPEEIKTVAESMENSLQRLMKTSGGGFWINGRTVDVERPSFNVFELIQMLQDELEELEELERRLEPVLSSGNSMKALEEIRDAFTRGDSFFSENDDGEEGEDIDEGEDASSETLFRVDLATGDKDSVIYMNDLEKDRNYSHLNPSIMNMIMAMQYGMPPSVRRNLFTVLAVVDPLEPESQTIGQGLISQLAQQEFPARLAMVVVNQEDVNACSKSIAAGKSCPVSVDHWLNDDHPPTVDELRKAKATTRDIHRLYAYMRQKFAFASQALVMYQMYLPISLRQKPASNGEFYSLFDVFNAHNEILRAIGIADSDDRLEDIAEALQLNQEDSMHSYGKAVLFAANKGIVPGMSFINGRPLPLNEDEAEKVQKIFNEEQSLVFNMIMNQEITDEKPRNFYYKLIKGNKKNVYPRLHPLLTGATRANSFLTISHNFGVESLLTPKSMQSVSALDSDAIFIYEAFLELDTPKGLSFALEVLNAMDTIPLSFGNANVSVKYRIIPSTLSSANTDICKVLNSAGKLGFEKTKDIFERLLENSDVAINEYIDLTDLSLCHDPPHLHEELPFKNFITANGRVYSIEKTSLSKVDIELLMTLGLQSSKKVSEMLKPHMNEAAISDAVGRTSAFLSRKTYEGSKRSGPTSFVASTEKKAEIGDNPFRFSWTEEARGVEDLRTKVVAIVDPTTETAQRLSPLLLIIRDELKLPLDLILAPHTELDGDSDIPISSYYRFVADPSAFQAGHDSASSPNARFSNLPTDHIFTLRMDVPEPWDVQQKRAIQDTDNLRCDLQSGCGDDLQAGIEIHRQTHVTNVVYELQHLLVSGQCYETSLSPPNGLQLVLSEQNLTSNPETASNTVSANVEADGSIRMEGDNLKSLGNGHYSDTLVMKTVGYWQLRANPGIWDLKINDKSRGAEIFQMVAGQIKHGSVKVSNPIPNNKKQLVVRDFIGRHKGKMLLVQRKPGYERATLFYENEKKASRDDDDDVVHVFSLATGHLYERFLKIMMLSVTKRTSTKVKFWLFENFLSPTFKASSMAMAKKIGCEVEFVTYKWPEWLRGQSEKQRIIWGYKILFLDVLFPLNVKKIIYVDADQVIRGDLKELRDMDLHGAPYGYTPMCSSNEATVGFQFWNQGFWKSHLRGKPYHISALYVVDLEKFRKDRVGDILRSQYQALSADPGSLANLDQDLPNYAQHQVPIFSLPQEWLWCESWCSNETKADSKTIDLCNNPLHKEPKVSMAKRIISGDLFEESWIELDAEVGKYENEYKLES